MTEPVTPQPVESETGEKASGRALAAMIIGIAAVVLGCCGYVPYAGWLGFVIAIGGGVAALILALTERKSISAGLSSEKGKTFALVGLILGIVSIVGSLFILIFQIVFIFVPSLIQNIPGINI